MGRSSLFEKWSHFFLGPWLLVCQFIDISNQIGVNGHVSNFEQKILYNRLLYKKFLSMFDISPVGSIWLEISINWHTKSQGPKKKCTYFTPVLPRPLVIRVILLHTEQIAQRHFYSTVCVFQNFLVSRIKSSQKGIRKL